MSFVKKIISFMKNIFNKKQEVKQIESPKESFEKQEKTNFIESLKVTTIKKVKKKKVETLVCEGDGLGIQKKIHY